jgi:hypothetical protein
LNVDFRDHFALEDLLDDTLELVTHVDRFDGHDEASCLMSSPSAWMGQALKVHCLDRQQKEYIIILLFNYGI